MNPVIRFNRSAASVERPPAIPAEVERRGIFLAAVRALDRGPLVRGRLQVQVDRLAGASRVQVALDPDLRKRGFDRKLARQARRVGIEDARGNLAGGEAVDEELCLGKVGGGIDPLQNFTETITLPPFSFTPERPETVKAEIARPTSGRM